ncbi:23S rRNA (uracil1939-C5)-methyltransferase [Neisseria sp. HSC-16F19]|nr:23S rRNA (uracil(1939)-C(5))-methyltransferase RlmD [Neisseria sp. HSC-16F19]MCP2040906.1 23S rRNA (uracil1939-C5)-methyltransferase [Neisseria sp. HSC-16F19]
MVSKHNPGAGCATVTVHGFDHQGRGVARHNGQVVFIPQALPGETVTLDIRHEHKNFAEGRVRHYHRTSPARTAPRCAVFGRCGGCGLQHIEASAQVALKQRVWEEQMQRIGGGLPQSILTPVYGLPWHYRQRARLSAAVDEQGRLQLGFQAAASHDVVDTDTCPVLPHTVSAALSALKALLQAHHRALDLSGVSFAQGEDHLAWVLHIGRTPSAHTQQALQAWLAQRGAHESLWLQYPRRRVQAWLPENPPPLDYTLPDFGIRIAYRPDDFTQINHRMNALMVSRALHALAPQPNERIIDWFCGLGNFSLPIARMGAEVLGIEGVAAMAERATKMARDNGLDAHCRFEAADLFKVDGRRLRQWGRADKWLLDPPRAGAAALVGALDNLPPQQRPHTIVYVSCNPATLARDTATLRRHGYVCTEGGILNLFPQTAHVESVAVFRLPETTPPL